MDKLAQVLVTPDKSIREVMALLDRNAKGIVLVVKTDRRLIGTITDGDIRRAVLAGINLDQPVQVLLERREPPYSSPITAPAGTPNARLLQMMNEYTIRQIPLVDKAGRVVDLALLSDLTKEYELPLTAVVMAGGYGVRLRPLTDKVPKPMLPVGDRPLLEHIIEQLQQAGIRRVNVATHYKGDTISKHFGDGRDFGVEINYVKEDQPLGTAGALSLLETTGEPLLVINGDIMTRVDFRAMHSFHRKQKADMTVGVRKYEVNLPYGVIESDGSLVRGVTEKPSLSFFINAGIYLLQPSVLRYIPTGQHFDMTELIQIVLDKGHRVASFPIFEYWLDIGNKVDYEQAQEKYQERES